MCVGCWYEEYGGCIFEQMCALGFSLDWSRICFIFDLEYVWVIRIVFKVFYDEGFIYRGLCIVNWCLWDCSVISDEEIEW